MLCRCPHCHNPIEIVADDPLSDIECPSCGSHFELVDDQSTVPYQQKPKTIAHFELLAQVGTGRFGSVWKARDTQLDRIVAVKIPRSGRREDAETAQFLREARAAAQVTHPNIVRVYEVGRELGTMYIVSDFIDGANLKDYVRAQPLTFRETAELCATIADALHAAHEAGVIHRDLKPQNIMMDADGAPHVADFGLAKREAGEITMTVDGQILGTPAYMPPEQIEKAHEVDGRADVYSLGVILYELLTQELPFRGQRQMVLLQIQRDEPTAPRKLNNRIPRDLETICLKCLEKDRARRYATAAELAADCRRYLKGEPIAARPVSRTERGWRWCRRNRLVASLTVGVAAALMIGSVVSATFAVSAAHSAAKARAASELASRRESEARINAVKAQHRLVQRDVADCFRLVEAGDWSGSLNHLVEALSDSRGDAKLELDSRIRLGIMLRQLPKIARLFRPAENPQFSQGGRYILLRQIHQKAEIWDTASAEPVTLPLESDEHIWALDPGGRFAISLRPRHQVRLWDIGAKRLAVPPFEHDVPIYHTAFSSGGQVATAGYSKDESQSHFYVWSTRSGEATCPPFEHEGSISSMDFNSDGTRLMAEMSLHDSSHACVWELAGGKMVGPAIHAMKPSDNLVFSRDGKRVLIWSRDGHAQVFDTATGQALTPLLHHGDGDDDAESGPTLLHTELSPGGSLVLTAGYGGRTKVWKSDTGKPACPDLESGDALVFHAAFSPEGRRVVTACDDNTARVWDVTTGKPVTPLMVHDAKVTYATFSPDGQTVATCSLDNTARIWDAFSGSPVGPPLAHVGEVDRAAFSPDGQFLQTLTRRGEAFLWDLVTESFESAPHGTSNRTTSEKILRSDGLRLLTIHGHQQTRYRSYSNDSNGKKIVQPARVELWDAARGQQVAVLCHHDDGVIDYAAFSSNGSRVVTVSGDWKEKDVRLHSGVDVLLEARIWDANTGKPVTPTLPLGSGTGRAALSADHAMLYTASDTARIWDVASGRPASAALELYDRGSVLAVSSIGTVFVTTLGGAELWHLTTGKSAPEVFKHDGSIEHAAFSHDGTMVVTATKKNGATTSEVRVWNTETCRAITAALRASGNVVHLCFSPDQRAVVAVSNVGEYRNELGEIRMWEIETGLPLSPPLSHPGRLSSATFGDDSSRLYSVGDKDAFVWNLRPDQRPLDDLRRLVNAVSARKLDAAGGLETLEPEDLMKIWQSVRPEGRSNSLGWHSARAIACEKAVNWQGTYYHINRLIQLDSDRMDYFARRAKSLFYLQRNRESFVDYAKAVELGWEPDNHAAGLINDVTWSVVAAKDSDSEICRMAVKVLELVCCLYPEDGMTLNTLGVAQYRSADYKEALTTLTRSEQLISDNKFYGGESPFDIAFLAMTLQQLGDTDKATARLLQLRNVVQKPKWVEDEELQSFVQEAETLIEGHSTPSVESPQATPPKQP